MNDPLERFKAAVAERYVIERELGRGGMATVFLAEDLKHHRPVAVKILRPELAAALGPDRFLREIEIAAHLTHPHILPLHDSGEAAGSLYYVMPYVAGESLRNRLLREDLLPLEEAVRIAVDVADALGYAHTRGFVHRDIKPENILLVERHAVVADFGIARAVSAAGGARVTSAGISVGTPGYMSPEQASGAQELDGRSDIFSLGCVLHEMLIGRLPPGQAEELGARKRSRPAQRPTIPVALQQALDRALAGAPSDRFGNAQEFGAALTQALEPAPVGATTMRLRQGVLVTIAAALVAAGVLLVLRGGTPKVMRSSAAAADDILATTTSPIAQAQLRLGQERFWVADLDGAAAAYRRAIEADSDDALAYHRLSVVQTWQTDYPAALRTVEAGLARRDRFSPRWRQLVEAQRQYVMRNGDSAIASFQALAVDHPRMPDAWYGLGEALFHFAGVAGSSPLDAENVFERLVGLDSTFAPIYYHLVDLAAYRGDSARALRFLEHVGADDQTRAPADAVVALTFGDSAARARMMRSLRDADRSTLSLLVAHFGHGALDLPLVDTLAAYLMQADRTPDDRLRGAQYRLVALAGQGRWREAVATWDAVGHAERFDRWMVLAYLAGFPAKEHVEPMFQWAQGLFARGQIPDFTRGSWELPQQAFGGLVHRATVEGDSTEVLGLLRRLEGVSRHADPSDPLPSALRAALLSRLAMLAADTTTGLTLLERSASRSAEPLGTFFPFMTMGPERWLLAEITAARGDRQRASRWLESFTNTWSLGDVLYLHRVACLRRRLQDGARRALTPHDSACVT